MSVLHDRWAGHSMGAEVEIVRLEPGPKPNTIFVPLPDLIIEYLGWKEGDAIAIGIHQTFREGSEYLVLKRSVLRRL